MKLLIQLEIEYEDSILKNDYIDLIKTIKNYYENNYSVPSTEEMKFKSLGIVKISRVIQ